MKIWLIGAYGIVSTTAMVGGKALEKGIIGTTGLVSELPFFKKIGKYAPLQFLFSGHEIRVLSNAYEAAVEHWEANRHYNRDMLDSAEEELRMIRAEKGTALNCGSGIAELGNIETLENECVGLREIADRVVNDMKKFADDETVVINIASTEPPPRYSKEYHSNIDGFESMLDEDKKEFATASMLYAYAALKLKLPYGNFTPSVGSGIPALKELANKNKVPHAGNDGKTGETLVKTTLAPMFLYRNLDVLGWMGYNILGDYDGRVLSHRDNKEGKVVSKDGVLEKVLGYSPYSITEIGFFPSLEDNKTAFDFVHFKGFLGTKMKMYFVWDAVDAIVAAPLILDIARFLLFAKKRGVYGVVKELGFFFKNPMGMEIVNTHQQFEILKEWFDRVIED